MEGERKRNGGNEREGREEWEGRKRKKGGAMNDILYHSGLVWGCVCRKLPPVPGWQLSPPRRVPADAGTQRQDILHLHAVQTVG